MVIAWDSEWGDFSTFRNWVNEGENDPPWTGFSPDAVKMFRQSGE
jgi:hypothetical protein